MSDQVNSGDHAIQKAFDVDSNSIKTTLTNADVNINVSAFTDSIAIADDSGNKATTTLVGSKRGLDVNVVDVTLSAANDSVAIGDGTNTAIIYDYAGHKALATKDLHTMPMTTIVDTSDASNTYIGIALPGSSESAASWRIKRINVSGSITKTAWPSGDGSFTYIWNSRASYTYT